MIEISQVCKSYSRGENSAVHALRDVSFHVEAAEFLAIRGPSGSGKSTLLNILGCLDVPTSGSYRLAGEDVSCCTDRELSRVRARSIGFIFQSFQLIHTLTVFENVELPLLLAGKKNARETARERLAWVELDGLGERYPHQLSGGQMQRVAIARALVQSPSMLLADEPTGNLDSATSNLILSLLQRLTLEQDTATLMATHSVEAAALANVVVRLRDGQIAEIMRR